MSDSHHTSVVIRTTITLERGVDQHGDACTIKYVKTDVPVSGDVVIINPEITVSGKSETSEKAPSYLYPVPPDCIEDPTYTHTPLRKTPGYTFVPGVGIRTSAPITSLRSAFATKQGLDDAFVRDWLSKWDTSTVVDMSGKKYKD